MLETAINALHALSPLILKPVYGVRLSSETLLILISNKTDLPSMCKYFHNTMSSENVSYLISSSNTFSPLPIFPTPAEIRIHLRLDVHVYYNNVCVCTSPVMNLEMHLQKAGSTAVTAIMEAGSMFYSLTLINQIYADEMLSSTEGLKLGTKQLIAALRFPWSQ